MQKAKKGLIKGIPQGKVFTEEEPRGFLASRPDGIMYEKAVQRYGLKLKQTGGMVYIKLQDIPSEHEKV